MRKKTKFKKAFIKYALPLTGLIGILGFILMNSKHITAEIPTDQEPDPWPLTQDSCEVKK